MARLYRIDRDTRTLILKYIRKYDEYVMWYHAERDRASTLPIAADAHLLHGTDIPDPTLRAVEYLDKLDHHHRVKVIRAIDYAKENIGNDIVSDDAREALRRAIWLSCLNGREYNFAAFAGLICCEQRSFYRYKNEFLNDIKFMLGL